MAYDRTEEFIAAAEAYTSTLSNGGYSSDITNRRISNTEKNFNALASEMGNALHSTSLKLQELAKLARQCGIYNDKTVQIQELTFEIRKDINILNIKIDEVEEATKKGEYDRGSDSQEHYKTVSNVLRTRLVDITKEFKEILTLRAETLKRQDRRRNLYSFGGDSGMNDAEEETFDIEGGQRTSLMSRQTNYSQARAEAVENVQRVIYELGSIFQRVGALIVSQEEMIVRIDRDIDSSIHHIRQGLSPSYVFYLVLRLLLKLNPKP